MPGHDPCQIASDAIAFPEHVWTAIEPVWRISNESDVPQALLGVMQELCSLSEQLVEVPVRQ